jgi:hypothetical protein
MYLAFKHENQYPSTDMDYFARNRKMTARISGGCSPSRYLHRSTLWYFLNCLVVPYRSGGIPLNNLRTKRGFF